LNNLIPEVVVLSTIVLLLGYVSIGTLKKAMRTWKDENHQIILRKSQKIELMDLKKIQLKNGSVGSNNSQEFKDIKIAKINQEIKDIEASSEESASQESIDAQTEKL